MARHLVFVLSADVYCCLSAVFSRLCLRTLWVRRSTLYKKLSMHATARNRSHCYYVESLLWCTSGILLNNLTKTIRHVVGYVKPFANFFSSVQLIHIVLLSIFDNRSESSYKGLSLSASRSTCCCTTERVVCLTVKTAVLVSAICCDQTTGSAVAAASDIHRQMPTHMADIRRYWPTNQNTDW